MSGQRRDREVIVPDLHRELSREREISYATVKTIVNRLEEGLQEIEYLKEKSSGWSSFIPLRHLRPKKKTESEGNSVPLPSLLSRVKVKDGYGPIAEYLFSDVYLVE